MGVFSHGWNLQGAFALSKSGGEFLAFTKSVAINNTTDEGSTYADYVISSKDSSGLTLASTNEGVFLTSSSKGIYSENAEKESLETIEILEFIQLPGQFQIPTPDGVRIEALNDIIVEQAIGSAIELGQGGSVALYSTDGSITLGKADSAEPAILAEAVAKARVSASNLITLNGGVSMKESALEFESLSLHSNGDFAAVNASTTLKTNSLEVVGSLSLENPLDFTWQAKAEDTPRTLFVNNYREEQTDSPDYSSGIRYDALRLKGESASLNLSDLDKIELRTQTDEEGLNVYKGIGDSVYSSPVHAAALRSITNASVDLTGSGTRTIVGAIVAGSGESGNTTSGGSIKLGGQLTLLGDIFAGNGGTVDIALDKNSMMEGQADDYYQLKYAQAESDVFHNSAFFNGTEEIPVEAAGNIKLNFNGGTWIARGKSFVSEVNFGELGGIIDMTKQAGTSLSVDKMTGAGDIHMSVNGIDRSQSDMLYVHEFSKGSEATVHLTLNGGTFADLDGLRFATTSSNSGQSGNFKVIAEDQGFYDYKYSVRTTEYNVEDPDNEIYNGGVNIASTLSDTAKLSKANTPNSETGEGTFKPGTNAVDDAFENDDAAINWYLDQGEKEPEEDDGNSGEKPTGPSTSLSDAGNALLATARGTYWTAVEIDRLTNRMGDARYANNGEDGLWVRLRQSRLGTDYGEGDFKSSNTTYQLGYDHAFRRDNGRQLVGIAFDYMDTDLDYKGMSGEGNTDRYGITAYTTWLADNGFYVDVVGKWGRLDNNFDIVNGSGNRVKADYDNNMWAVSAEVGRKLSNPKTGMFIEPNAQLQYTMVTDAQYSTSQGTRIDQDRIDSVIGRMGVRIGRAFGEQQNHNFYAKADIFREFMGEQKIHVKDVTTHLEGDTITVQNKGTWFDVGGGFQSQLGDNAYAYADVEYRFGNDLDKSWIVNAGMRYEF